MTHPDLPAEDTVTAWDGPHALAWEDMDGFWHLATFDTVEQRQSFAVELGTDHGILSHFLDHLIPLDLNDIADGKVEIAETYIGGEVSVPVEAVQPAEVEQPGIEEFLAVGDAKDVEDDENELGGDDDLPPVVEDFER